MSEVYASVTFVNGRYEFSCPSLDLIVRGPHPEWVLEAGADMIAQSEHMRMDGLIEELSVLQDLGDAPEVEVDIARFETKSRFEAVPQCVVSLGVHDFRWVSPAGRQAGEKGLQRLFDQSLTRNETFLVDQQQ